MLADKVEIGDYVNYPVYYDNVNGSTLKGWRVISKNIDLDGNPSPGTVNLISAGVPLTYHHANSTNESVENLTTNFLETPFMTSTVRTYRKTGFLPYVSLTKTFKNKYTNVSGEKIQVRAMKAEDIYRVTGLTEMQTRGTMNLNDIKYNKLFSNGFTYYLASAYDFNYLWYVYDNGNVYNNNGNREFRNPSSCFSTPYSKSIW